MLGIGKCGKTERRRDFNRKKEEENRRTVWEEATPSRWKDKTGRIRTPFQTVRANFY